MLLTTSMRDAAIAGPTLRKAHRRVGFYLTTEFVTDVIGLEKFPIGHVLGHQVKGNRLFQDRQTTIVALMRGRELMAVGINNVFPLAMSVHVSNAEDV